MYVFFIERQTLKNVYENRSIAFELMSIKTDSEYFCFLWK